jgi:hypothetical protein
VTEAEFQCCTDPRAMLDWLRSDGKLSERKARLFGVACCRDVAFLLDERTLATLERIEQHTEGCDNSMDIAMEENLGMVACRRSYLRG